jgi:hypothetical protein
MTAYDDRTGTLWVGAISFASNGWRLFAARKIAGQPAFEPSVMASITGFADKGWMAAGPAPGNPNATNVYIAYNLGVLRSTNMGDTWTGPVALGTGIGFLPRVGPNGELYVAFWDYGSGVLLKRSFDGGQTFGPEIRIATRMDVWGTQSHSRFPGTFRVPPFNYLAVDQNNGTLYCVYFDTTNIVGGNYNIDLYFTKSSNQGLTWTTPVVINNDNVPPGDQFWPWIEVDEESNLHMVFLDSRHTVQNDDVVNGLLDAYYSFSNDGGAAWQEFRLTLVSFDSDNDGLRSYPNRANQGLGDCLGLARSQDRVYPCYLSTQNDDPDIYTHVVRILGGCCLVGSCALLSKDCCASQGGTFLGAGTTCGAAGGACCTGTMCTVTPQTCCSSQGGAFIGVGTTCDDCNGNGDPDACETEGLHPCCLPSLSCVLWTAECCSAVGGQFFPTKNKCTYVNCTAMGPTLEP